VHTSPAALQASEGDGERQQPDHEGRQRDAAGLDGLRQQRVVQDVADDAEPGEGAPLAPAERALQPAPGRGEEHGGDEAVGEIASGGQLQRREIGGQPGREEDESPEGAGDDAGRTAEAGFVGGHGGAPDAESRHCRGRVGGRLGNGYRIFDQVHNISEWKCYDWHRMRCPRGHRPARSLPE
jgi:hypothetical protein